MKVPIKSLNSFKPCSEDCALYEVCKIPSSLKVADIGYAVRRITRDADSMANLQLAVNAPEFVSRVVRISDVDESYTDAVWQCSRSRALGTCASISSVDVDSSIL